MQKLLKPAFFFTAILVCFLFFFAAARNTSGNFAVPAAIANPAVTDNSNESESSMAALYAELDLSSKGLAQEVFNSAVRGLKKLNETGVIRHDEIISIVDFSQPSTQKRLYVVDLKNKQVLFHTYVAHGRNTGGLWARSFSNEPSSLKSSPGFYSTAETYMGEHGYSLRLDGLEKNINDKARARAVVMHAADYASESAIRSLGFLGRSWGCPAVPVSLHKPIINTIKGGTCLFIYCPEKSYQERSSIFNS